MESRVDNTAFRSVRLIQRGDMTRLTSHYADGRADDTVRTRVSEPLREARESDDQEWLERRAQRLERRRQRATSSRSTRRRDRDGGQEREERTPRDAFATSGWQEPHRTPSEQVSAYMGESGAGEATRRSDRRGRLGFRLVPLQTPARMDDFDRYDAGYDTDDGYDADNGYNDYTDDAATNYVDDLDEALPYGDLSERRANRRARKASRKFQPQSTRSEEPAYEVRSPFYTEEDYREQRGLPGSSSRRQAVANALATVPRAVGSTAVRALGHLSFLLVAGFIVATLVLLYGPARDLYIANRRLAVLQATYEALLAENDSIRGELEALQTREGIENEARERGYVQAGETKVIVEGLPEELLAQDGAAAAVADIEVSDEQPWYVQVLDRVFAYQGG